MTARQSRLTGALLSCGERSSWPIHTPQASTGEKPTNHRSRRSVVVPLFPARDMPGNAASVPVPQAITSSMADVRSRAVDGRTASRSSGTVSKRTAPSRSRIRV